MLRREKKGLKMKKKDLILIMVILLAACMIGGILYFTNRTRTGALQITVDGEIYGEYRLDEEQKITIGETNVLLIQDGYADMITANCPDKICVRQNAISKRGESIICLPNKVVVTVTKGEEGEFDVVAQ